MKKLLFIFLLFSTGCVFAEGVISVREIKKEYDGGSENSGGYVHLVLNYLGLKNNKELFEASATVGSQWGSGQIDGFGEYANNQLIIKTTDGDDDGKCILTVKFKNKGKSATIVSNSGCSTYHGGSVGWVGQKMRSVK